MKTTKKLFLAWIILMFVVTFTCSLVYLVAQQSLRLGANELPAQLAKDTALKLQNGTNAEAALPADKVDLSKSLSPFVMVFDKNKNLVSASGMMGNNKPSYPKSVLDYVDKHGEDRVTWQPQTGLRFATVAIKYDNGYVVAGQSLLETEKLIDVIGKLVLTAWMAFLVCSSIAFIIVYSFLRKYKQTN